MLWPSSLPFKMGIAFLACPPPPSHVNEYMALLEQDYSNQRITGQDPGWMTCAQSSNWWRPEGGGLSASQDTHWRFMNTVDRHAMVRLHVRHT